MIKSMKSKIYPFQVTYTLTNIYNDVITTTTIKTEYSHYLQEFPHAH